MTINTGNHYIMTNVELTLLVEQRMLNITLNYEGLGTSISVFLFFLNNVSNLLQSKAHLNSATSIRVFPRLDYPCIMFVLLWIIGFNVLSSFIIKL